MTIQQLTEELSRYDTSREVFVQNSFDYDDIDGSEVYAVKPDGSKVVVKINPNTVMMDIGGLCMLQKKAEMLDQLLDKVSHIIVSSSGKSREQVIEELKHAAVVKVEDIAQCIPPIL